ncbi:hypothetical protein EDB86DRAFT_2801244 [Lactarius hatsudake]|nr:hypothetical protein EDB86DRAFT_2801244 [Lactarius hatsudake]
MHLTVLNEPDLFLKLFTGKLDVGDDDDRETWDWAVFYKKTPLWNAHGDTVAQTVPYIPSSFGRAPRDPSKKINSGYKAWEYQQYFYGLGPTLFRHLLPRKYWLNYCKLVSGVRILQRHSITFEDVLKGHRLLMAFVEEFEDLYYQRMEARIHFVRHSIHMLTHIAPETLRAGPLACYAQWTLETAIGNLGREIRQDRDLYANLTQRAILRAQVNSLQARFPGVRLEIRGQRGTSLPRGAREFEGCGGYALFPRCEQYPTPLSEDKLVALMTYWRQQGWPNRDSWSKTICRWAKLRLPNGQMARSVWQESRILSNVRRASCIEYNSTMRIANVEFYFYMRFGESHHPLAMVTLFSLPDKDVFSDSSKTVYLCEPTQTRVVIPITAINMVVSMFPEYKVDDNGVEDTGKFSLMRHAYLEVTKYPAEEDEDEESLEDG